MIEAPQNEHTDYEAVYISENFGIPFTTALQTTQEAADKKAKAKKKKNEPLSRSRITTLLFSARLRKAVLQSLHPR